MKMIPNIRNVKFRNAAIAVAAVAIIVSKVDINADVKIEEIDCTRIYKEFATDIDTLLACLGVDNPKSGGNGSPKKSIDANVRTGLRGDIKTSIQDFRENGTLIGGRSHASIQRVVVQQMVALRHFYNRRLRDKPDLQGTITVNFKIDESGNVISARVAGSTVNDIELEEIVLSRVKNWKFDMIDVHGDVTDVTYPLVFSLLD